MGGPDPDKDGKMYYGFEYASDATVHCKASTMKEAIEKVKKELSSQLRKFINKKKQLLKPRVDDSRNSRKDREYGEKIEKEYSRKNADWVWSHKVVDALLLAESILKENSDQEKKALPVVKNDQKNITK